MKTPLESAEYLVNSFGLVGSIKAVNLLIVNTTPMDDRQSASVKPTTHNMEYWQKVKDHIQEGMGELSVFLQNIETDYPKAREIITRALAEQHKNTRHQVIEYLLEKGEGTPEVEEMTRDIMNLYQKSPLDGYTQIHDKLKYD